MAAAIELHHRPAPATNNQPTNASTLAADLNVLQIYGMWCGVFVCPFACAAHSVQFRGSPQQRHKINELELYAITSNTKLFRLYTKRRLKV